MPDEFKNIKLNRTGNVLEIILNNPPMNIMTQAMMVEINSVLEKLQEDEDLHLLIFKAEGKHFSAGADVAEHTKDKCGEMIPEFSKLFINLNKITCPVIAVVHGLVLGGGCELAIFCDMIVASEKTKIGQPEISVGVFPPLGTVIFPYLVGRNRALELLLTGDVIPAVEAERIGLINKVFPEDQFEEKTEEFIAKFTEKSPVVLKYTKKAVDCGLYEPVLHALKTAEKIYLDELMNTVDANEGIQAFMEKRKPEWTGK